MCALLDDGFSSLPTLKKLQNLSQCGGDVCVCSMRWSHVYHTTVSAIETRFLSLVREKVKRSNNNYIFHKNFACALSSLLLLLLGKLGIYIYFFLHNTIGYCM